MARGDEVAGGVVATVPVEVVDDENAPSDSLPPLDGRAAPVACVEAEADLLQEDGAMFEYKPDAASEWVPRQVQGSVTCHAPKVQVS